MRHRKSGVVVLSSLVALVACSESKDSASRSTAPALSPVTVPAPTATAAPTSTPALNPDAGLSLRFGALQERTLNKNADGTKTTAAVIGTNQFTIDLFGAVSADQPDNLVISPYSVTFALSMIYAGANGQTASEMATVLHADMPVGDWHEGINAYDLTLDARTAGSPTTWAAANKVWTKPGLKLRNEFL
jgi:hypothetical protein